MSPTQKYGLAAFFTLTLFVLSCILIVYASDAISKSATATNILLGIAGVTAIGWPVLLARSFQEFLRSRRNRD